MTSGSRAPSPLLVTLLIALLCVIWGSTWFVIAEGLRDLSPFVSAGARFVVAAVAMILVTPWLSRREGGEPPRTWLWVSVGVLQFAASYAIVYHAETVLPSGLVAVLWAVYPLITAIGERAYLGIRMPPRKIAGLSMGFLGMVVLFATDLQRFGPEAVPAALFLLLSPVVSLVSTLLVKRHGGRVNSVLITRNGLTLAAVLLLAMAFLFEDVGAVRWTSAAVGSVAYLALLGTCLTFTIYFWLLRHTDAGRLSLITFVSPMIALLLGSFVGDEPLSGEILVGSALILGGVALAARARRAPSQAAASA